MTPTEFQPNRRMVGASKNLRYVESLVRELCKAGVTVRVIPATALSDDQVPDWVSNKGEGMVAYLEVAATGFHKFEEIADRLLKYCEVCGAHFFVEEFYCPDCSAVHPTAR